jgi:hypothetical protein
VKERVELYNLRTDHVMRRSELKYLIGGQVVMLKCRVFEVKTGPFPVGRVFRGVRPVATVRFRVEPEPEPTREIGPVANTSPGNPPASRVLTGGSVQFGSKPGQNPDPRLACRVVTRPRHRTAVIWPGWNRTAVPNLRFLQLWLQLCI